MAETFISHYRRSLAAVFPHGACGPHALQLHVRPVRGHPLADQLSGRRHYLAEPPQANNDDGQS